MTLSSAAQGLVPPALTLVDDTLTGYCNHLLSSRMVVLLGDCQAAAVIRADAGGGWGLRHPCIDNSLHVLQESQKEKQRKQKAHTYLVVNTL